MKVKIVADADGLKIEGTVVEVTQDVAVLMLRDGTAQPVVDRPDRDLEAR